MAPAADSPTETSSSVFTTIASLRESLCSEEAALSLRFRALFSLKHVGQTSEDPAVVTAVIDAIAAALSSPSALLKHELAYCLGQTNSDAAIKPLSDALSDLDEDVMCRHEAAEALGALGFTESLNLLRKFRDREGESVVITETCEIAIDRIEWANSKERQAEKLRQSDFASIDPAPPMPETNTTKSVEDLGAALMDTSKPLFKRYRAMFALRDLASPPDLPTAVPAVQALAKGFSDESALFRHEIAFVFGQLCHPASVDALTKALSDVNEASMVRHEAAEALGSLGDEEGVEDTLRKFLNDADSVVRDSIIVALDMAEHEKSAEAEYALIPDALTATA
ncbi:deoxyhypusine monooxygenase [Geosmithia morbida]|uniref:Deoxyhypusine hydroxylase n=1 Tax=Geosmithia morbida TaxID=1094350 RepID=A0A9P4Z0S9_9HYPO|nr:deoxyhypusine monooxygenase [Geosmithia morbida]KAF4126608.1 deoxyhypusine monooxygenase [Geosmithia morbida]